MNRVQQTTSHHNSTADGSCEPVESLNLTFPSSVFDDFNSSAPMSISPRDSLSFIDDKKDCKANRAFHDRHHRQLSTLTRYLQTEIMRRKPDDIVDFLNDEFFSLENQSKLRVLLKN